MALTMPTSAAFFLLVFLFLRFFTCFAVGSLTHLHIDGLYPLAASHIAALSSKWRDMRSLIIGVATGEAHSLLGIARHLTAAISNMSNITSLDFGWARDYYIQWQSSRMFEGANWTLPKLRSLTTRDGVLPAFAAPALEVFHNTSAQSVEDVMAVFKQAHQLRELEIESPSHGDAFSDALVVVLEGGACRQLQRLKLSADIKADATMQALCKHPRPLTSFVLESLPSPIHASAFLAAHPSVAVFYVGSKPDHSYTRSKPKPKAKSKKKATAANESKTHVVATSASRAPVPWLFTLKLFHFDDAFFNALLFPRLEKLKLESCRAALVSIGSVLAACPTLWSLHMDEVEVEDFSLSATYPNLREIVFSNMPVCSRGDEFISFLSALPQLRTLECEAPSRLDIFVAVAEQTEGQRALTRLQQLILRPHLDPHGKPAIGQPYTAATLKRLVLACPMLTDLKFGQLVSDKQKSYFLGMDLGRVVQLHERAYLNVW